jgi:hypothetical protein
MNFDEFSKPMLTEPGVKYFLNATLKQCNEFRNKYNNVLINVCLLVGFIIVLGLILLYKYKGRLSPSEKERKNREKQQYILTRIKQLQETKRRSHQELITGLPNWDNEYDNVIRK